MAKPGPGKTGYLLALIVALAGIGMAAYYINDITNVMDSVQDGNVIVPGSKEIILKDAGSYTIDLVTRRGSYNNQDQDGGNLSGLAITIIRKDTGEEILVSKPGYSANTTVNGVRKDLINTFEVTEPCTIVLSGKFNPPAEDARTELEVGRSVISQVLGIAGSLLLGFLVSLILFIVTLVRRSKGKKAAQYPQATSPPAMNM